MCRWPQSQAFTARFAIAILVFVLLTPVILAQDILMFSGYGKVLYWAEAPGGRVEMERPASAEIYVHPGWLDVWGTYRYSCVSADLTCDDNQQFTLPPYYTERSLDVCSNKTTFSCDYNAAGDFDVRESGDPHDSRIRTFTGEVDSPFMSLWILHEYIDTYTDINSNEVELLEYALFMFDDLSLYGDIPNPVLLKFQGDVEVCQSGDCDSGEDEWVNAVPGMLLGTNSTLNTGYHSSARVLLPDGRVLNISGMTQIRLDKKSTSAPYLWDQHIDLKQGLLEITDPDEYARQEEERRARIERLMEASHHVISETSFHVVTPTPCWSVRGTRFTLQADSNGVGSIEILDGLVDMMVTNSLGHTITQTLCSGQSTAFSSNHSTSIIDHRQTRSASFSFASSERSRWRFDDDRWALTGGSLLFSGQGRGGSPRAMLTRTFYDFDCTFSSQVDAACAGWGLLARTETGNTNGYTITFAPSGAWSVDRYTNGVGVLVAQGTGGPGAGWHSNCLSAAFGVLSLTVDGIRLFSVTNEAPLRGQLGFFVEDDPVCNAEIRDLLLEFQVVDFDGDGLDDNWEVDLMLSGESIPVYGIDEIWPGDDLDGDGYTQAQEYDFWTDPASPREEPGSAAGEITLQRDWTHLFGNSSFNRFYDAVLTDSNRIYVVGYSYGPINGLPGSQADAMVLALDGAGQLLWSTNFGDPAVGDYAYGIAVTTGGLLAVCGETLGGFGGWTNAGGRDAFMATFTTNGVLQNSTCFGGDQDEQARSLACSTNGEISVAGRTYGDLLGITNQGTNDGYVANFDDQGLLRWIHAWQSADSENIGSVFYDGDGNLLIAGFVGGSIDDQPMVGGRDLCVQSLTPGGSVRWTRITGTGGNDYAWRSAAVAGDGSFLLAGMTYGAFSADVPHGNGDSFLVRLTPDGDVRSTLSWGTSARDLVQTVQPMGQGLIAIASASEGDWPASTNQGSFDIVLQIVDAKNHVVAQDALGTSLSDYPYALVSSGNHLYLVGYTEGDLDGEINHGERDGFITRWTLNGVAPEPPAATAPTLHQVIVDPQAYTLSWSPLIGATYQLEISTNLQQGFSVLETDIEDASFTGTNLTENLLFWAIRYSVPQE